MKPTLTVTQFNAVVNEILDPLAVIVEGEISQWQIWQNKYIYGAIKDENATAQIFATLYDIKNAASIAVGMKVVIRGKPTLHAKTGKFSLTAHEIIPSGDGAIAQAFDVLKKKLEEEGIFSTARKRPIPKFPTHVGLITAKDSQAYNDFTKILGERWPGVSIYFYPAQVQGKDSVQSIVKAINYFNTNFKENEIEVLVIARGGGSSEDLISFNDEQLVRAVYASKFPVVSGVGHEGDITLIDYVADLRASTPSNAAELISPNKKELGEKLTHYESLLKNDIRLMIENSERDLADTGIDLTRNFQNMISNVDDKLNNYERLLNSYSYKNILKRGFAIVRNTNKKIISSGDELKAGDEISIEFDSTNIDAKILKKEEVSNLTIF